MTPDPGSTRERQIGGAHGGNKNQKTKGSNENRRKTRPGKRIEEDAAGRGKAPEVRNRRPPQKNGTEKTQRANRINLPNEKGSRPEKTGVYPRRRTETAAGN